jgi:hypothetical protein
MELIKTINTKSRYLLFITEYWGLESSRLSLYASANEKLNISVSNEYFLKAKIPYPFYFHGSIYFYLYIYVYYSYKNICIDVVDDKQGNLLWNLRQDSIIDGNNILTIFCEEDPYFWFDNQYNAINNDYVTLQYQGYEMRDVGRFLNSRAVVLEGSLEPFCSIYTNDNGKRVIEIVKKILMENLRPDDIRI